jgi:cytochrome P450
MLPPGPDRPLRVWELAALRRDPLRFFAELQRHGDVAHVAVRAAGLTLIRLTLVQDPAVIKKILVDDDAGFEKPRALKKLKELLGEGLLTSEGEHHRRQRRLMQPAFHRDAVLRYAPTMVECAARAEARWSDGAALDMAAELTLVTLAIAGRTLFSVDVTAEADEIGQALATLMERFPDLISPFARLWRLWPGKRNREIEAALGRLDATIFRIIAARRGSGELGDDLLGRLLAAEDEGKAGMTAQQVRDEAITLFLAGHETTAVALAWSMYLLALHPQAQAALHAELDAALGGRLPGADDLPRLVYTRRVLQEAMRLYPPAHAFGRGVLRPYAIGAYTIPAGRSMVFMCPYLLHRDERWFPAPLEFRPERWTPEFEAGLPRFAYVPFGGGARVCIGAGFAWMEGTLALATLLRRWSVALAPGAEVRPVPRVTLRPSALPMVVRRRGA